MTDRQPADVDRRLQFACPPRSGSIQGVDLSLLDSADPNDRHFLILADHPKLQRALDADVHEIELHGVRVNPQMHIALHEMVANQLVNDDPPEAWQTAERLQALGYQRHDVLHMLASVASDQVWSALHERRPHDPEAYKAALRGLPDSWEAMRPTVSQRPRRPRRGGRPRRKPNQR